MLPRENNKKLVFDFHQKILQAGQIETLASFLAPSFNQQHPLMEFGIAGFQSYLEKSGPWNQKIHRVLAEKDLVAVHYQVESASFPACAAWSLYQIKEGKITAYWQNHQVIPEKSVSGRGLLDGTSELIDLDQTAANKALVEDFYQTAIIGKNFGKARDFFEGDQYLQHNPMLPDGVSGFIKAMQVMAITGMGITINRIDQVIAEGNFVLIVATGRIMGKSYTTYDLFRVEKGKIAEHWDVMAELPIV